MKIKDYKDNEERYLKWDKAKGMFISSQNYEYNTQSTYLYYLLNGFSISDINDIKWVDSQRVLSTPIERTRKKCIPIRK